MYTLSVLSLPKKCLKHNGSFAGSLSFVPYGFNAFTEPVETEHDAECHCNDCTGSLSRQVNVYNDSWN